MNFVILKSLSFIFFFILTFTTATGFSKEFLSPHGVLEKASRRLRQNQLPSKNDYSELDAAVARGELEDFLDKKIITYAKSDRFADGMTFRLLEEFELNTPEVRTSGENADTLSRFFHRLAKENHSWDSLLTGTSYDIPFFNGGRRTLFARGDVDFLTEVLGTLLPETPPLNPIFTPELRQPTMHKTPPVIKRLEFPPKTPFIAGAITTARFFERYTNVALNKNRRRAAALFKIFLCDPMVPAIENGTSKKHEYLARAFPKDWSLSTDEIRSRLQSDADIHGKDAQCFACHYKLDPAGQTFQAIGLNLSQTTNPGALIYKNSTGTKVDIPVSDLNELGTQISGQDDYVACQVRKFWKWFVGADVPLEDARLQQLVRIFNHLNHQPQDFAAYLTRTIEFKTLPKKTERVSFTTVRPLLNRCDSCHHGIRTLQGGSLPQFTTTFSQLQPEHKPWLIQMKARMERTDMRRMPLDWQSWREEDLTFLKLWIQQSIGDLAEEKK